jgi:hypothetical protein
MVEVECKGILLGVILSSTSTAEVKPAEKTLTLNNMNIKRAGKDRPQKCPKRIIGYKGYNSDPLRNSLNYLKTDLITPYRYN